MQHERSHTGDYICFCHECHKVSAKAKNLSKQNLIVILYCLFSHLGYWVFWRNISCFTREKKPLNAAFVPRYFSIFFYLIIPLIYVSYMAQAFAEARNLKTHMLVHSDKRLFSCPNAPNRMKVWSDHFKALKFSLIY